MSFAAVRRSWPAGNRPGCPDAAQSSGPDRGQPVPDTSSEPSETIQIPVARESQKLTAVAQKAGRDVY